MNSKERVLARIKNQPVDRVPNLNILMFFAAKEIAIMCVCLFMICMPMSSKTWYVSNNGSDNSVGNRKYPFKTISKGADVAQPGDTVFVLAGIYRERVSPPRGGEDGNPIVYFGEPGKRVYIKGSDVYKGKWERSSNNIFIANLNGMKFTDDCYVDNANPFKVKVILDVPGDNAGTLGQVFVKSIPYLQMNTKEKMNVTVGSWWFDASSNKVYVHFKPQHSTKNTVELTTRRRIFAPHATEMGLGYIHVEGFVMEHCGNQFPKWGRETMQAGALGLQSGHHWVIRNNVVRYAANVGVDVGFMNTSTERDIMPGWKWSAPGIVGNLIEDNYLIDNGCVGITGVGTYQMIVRRNVVMWNNTQDYPMENAEQGGLKFHGCNSGLITENYVADNFAFGIWLDNHYPHTRVTRNIFVGNTSRGVAIEMSKYGFGDGALIDNNVIINNLPDMQIDLQDASGCLFVNNLIAGGKTGVQVRMAYNEPARWSNNNAFYNNIFCNNSDAIYDVLYPIARGGEQRFLGNLYDVTAKKMYINNFCDVNFTSPLSETTFQSQTAMDAGTNIETLNTAGALSTQWVKLNLDTWKTFWSKHTQHNDYDAEVMDGITAEFIPATQSIKLYLPAAVKKRLNSRWDTPYKSIYGLTEESSYPGPFDNLHVGVNEFKVYQGTLPILERGKLPSPKE
jgi:hypothetical protein